MRRQTNFIVVHCSATPETSDIGADEIKDWHVNGNGWSDIGYAAVIRRSGQVEFGRHFDAVGAHVKGRNYQSVGVCLVGGVDANGKAEFNFTPEQMKSLRVVVAMLVLAYPGAKVLGHRDLSPDLNGDGIVDKTEWVKDCPCFDVKTWFIGGST